MERLVTRLGNVKCFTREKNSRRAPDTNLLNFSFSLFFPCTFFTGRPDGIDGIAISHELDCAGFNSQHVQESFSFLKPPRPALVPTEPSS
jgi:hypothetical protein